MRSTIEKSGRARSRIEFSANGQRKGDVLDLSSEKQKDLEWRIARLKKIFKPLPVQGNLKVPEQLENKKKK